jgi:hypothetical protein
VPCDNSAVASLNDSHVWGAVFGPDDTLALAVLAGSRSGCRLVLRGLGAVPLVKEVSVSARAGATSVRLQGDCVVTTMRVEAT